jgi:myo-inositol-1(or 4)-monophosphatase
MTPLSLAKSTAKTAGEKLLRLFSSRNFSIERKSKHEIVTSADKISEKVIIAAIKQQFPTHQILSEESGLDKNDSEYLWIIDPLDGTTNFSTRNPYFCVSISLLYKNEPQIGVVYAPVTADLFYAEKGKGAFLNGRKIRVADTTNIKDAMLTFCHGNKNENIDHAIELYSKLKREAKDFRQLGSAALELAYVAAGFTDAIIIPGALPWDIAAGILLVREAGGKVTDFENKSWRFGAADMLAGSGKLHSSLIKFTQA